MIKRICDLCGSQDNVEFFRFFKNYQNLINDEYLEDDVISIDICSRCALKKLMKLSKMFSNGKYEINIHDFNSCILSH